MDIQQLRQSLKDKWLDYYRQNRHWLTRLGVWVNCDGQRRPSSGFILATLSTLEPQLIDLLPLIVDLSSNSDRIVMALGLNFNPDAELEALAEVNAELTEDDPKFLPAGGPKAIGGSDRISRFYTHKDESCEGTGRSREL